MAKQKLYWLQLYDLPLWRIENAQSLEECEKSKQMYPADFYKDSLKIVPTHKMAEVVYSVTFTNHDGDFHSHFCKSKEEAQKQLDIQNEKDFPETYTLTEHILLDTIEDL